MLRVFIVSRNIKYCYLPPVVFNIHDLFSGKTYDCVQITCVSKAEAYHSFFSFFNLYALIKNLEAFFAPFLSREIYYINLRLDSALSI